MRIRALVATMLTLAAITTAPAVAHAYVAHTTASLNVRAGPGVGYYRVGVLPPGAPVQVYSCAGRWCQIAYHRGPAWVSSRYLSRGPFVAPRFYRPMPHFGYRAPGFRLYIGPRPRPWWWY